MITEDLVYELIIEGEEDEVYAISMVSEPAIEAGWVAFDKEQVQFQAVDNDKRLVLGPILVPDKRILRIDGEGKPYHVFLSAPTIKKLSEKYLQNKYTDKVTVEHQKSISDVSLVESWIVESRTKDKSAVYGLSLTPGTWAGTMKVNNEKLWQDFVKTGKLTGFSIEGLFSHQLVEASKENYLFKEIDELTEYEAEIVLSKIKAMFESYADYGDEIKNNAKRGIELNEKVGNKCATQTGKVRAQQLANGEAISVETIKRMYSFLSRAETYYDETDTTACGTISYLLWGGKSALSYSRNKLRELGILEEAEQPSVVSSYPGEAVSGSSVPPILQDFEEPEIDIFGYGTKQFYICPGAIGTFEELKPLAKDEDTIGMIRSAEQIADNVFNIEKNAIQNKSTTQREVDEAIVLVADFKDLMKEIEEEVGKTFDVSYMDGHIVTIKSFLGE